MKERLERLKQLLEELKGESYTQQYGIADFDYPNQRDELAKESAFYQRILNEI